MKTPRLTKARDKLAQALERFIRTDAPGTIHRFTIYNSPYRTGPEAPTPGTTTYPTRREARADMNVTRMSLEADGWVVAKRPDHETLLMEKGSQYTTTLMVHSDPPPDNDDPVTRRP